MPCLYDKYLALQPDAVRSLENSRRGGHFAHAFLVHSPDIEARREFPIVLAQIAGCPSSRDGRPDTSCEYCRRLENGTYTESVTLSPSGKISSIKVGDRENPEENSVRGLTGWLDLSVGSAYPYKVGIIREADRMDKEAQNALLKTLEEPPAKSLLILSTASRDALLPTTVSRCQTVALRDTARKFDFDDAPELFAALESLCLPAAPDVASAEAGAETLIAIFGRIKENAAAAVEARYAGRLEALKAMDDTALTKRLMEQISDDSAGEYRLMRGRYLEAIQAYCGELYMMSRGVPAADLPFPEIIGRVSGMTVPPECGDRMLREADTLVRAMRTSAMDELILRAFAFAIVIG